MENSFSVQHNGESEVQDACTDAAISQNVPDSEAAQIPQEILFTTISQDYIAERKYYALRF